MLYTGLQYTTAINGALINSFTPIVTVFLAALALKEKVIRRQTGGTILSLLGVALIVTGGSPQVVFGLSFNRGDLIILMTTFVWAFYIVNGKRIMADVGPMEAISESGGRYCGAILKCISGNSGSRSGHTHRLSLFDQDHTRPVLCVIVPRHRIWYPRIKQGRTGGTQNED